MADTARPLDASDAPYLSKEAQPWLWVALAASIAVYAATSWPALHNWLEASKNLLQSMSWLVASFGGVIAAAMAIRQFRDTQVWKKTELAKNILDEIWQDERCATAMTLVDWTNRRFVLASGGEPVRISRDEVIEALRTDAGKLVFNEKEVFIRDCFDSLFDALQRLEHYIGTDLIEFEDVEYPLEYSVTELSGTEGSRLQESVRRYIQDYEFHYAAKFLDRYPFWKQGEKRGRLPCKQED